MKATTMTDDLTILDSKQAQQAERQLAEVRTRRGELEQERADTSGALGRALAAMRLGSRSANAKAGQLSLRRSSLDGELRDLRQTEAALEEALDAWEQTEIEQARTALVARFDQLTAEREEAEQRFAAVIVEGINTTKELNDNQRAYQQAVEEAARLRAPIPKGARPPHPQAVVRVTTVYTNMWDDPVGLADRWLRNGLQEGTRPQDLLHWGANGWERR